MPAASEKTRVLASVSVIRKTHRTSPLRAGAERPRTGKIASGVECVQEVAGNLPNTTSVSSEIGQEQKTECAHPFFFA